MHRRDPRLLLVSTDRVVIRIDKELELDDVERFYPAQHYVVLDDKLRILRAVKEVWGPRDRPQLTMENLILS